MPSISGIYQKIVSSFKKENPSKENTAKGNYDPTLGVCEFSVPEKEFEEELLDKHFEYTYDNGWTYQFWVPNKERIIYSISGGPMAGRSNFQTTYYQRIRKNLWQINWLEETGTIVSIVLDIDNKRITTFCVFSKGHWENPSIAHGDKRNPSDLKNWRNLARIGLQTNRYLLPEQATIDKIYDGPGELKPVELSHPTY